MNIMVYKQAYLINTDLKMKKGKIAAQVAHASMYYMEYIGYIEHLEKLSDYQMIQIENHTKWRMDDNELMTKIVMKATEDEINEVLGDMCYNKMWCSVVRDRGLTQVNEDSLTCFVAEPLYEKQYNKLFGKFKLL